LSSGSDDAAASRRSVGFPCGKNDFIRGGAVARLKLCLLYCSGITLIAPGLADFIRGGCRFAARSWVFPAGKRFNSKRRCRTAKAALAFSFRDYIICAWAG